MGSAIAEVNNHQKFSKFLRVGVVVDDQPVSDNPHATRFATLASKVDKNRSCLSPTASATNPDRTLLSPE